MRRTLTFITMFALMIGMLALPALATTYEPPLGEPHTGPGGNCLDQIRIDTDTYEGTKLDNDPRGSFDLGDGISIVVDARSVTASGGTVILCVKGGPGDGNSGTVILEDGDTFDYTIGDISNIVWYRVIPTFVPQGAVTITKTADPTFTRTHEWDIEKSVTTEKEFVLEDETPKIYLYADESGDEKATWTVDVTYEGFEDTDHALSGSIEVANAGALGARITNLVDTYGGGPVPIGDCKVDEVPFVFGLAGTVLEPGETLVCSYIVAEADKELTENMARVGGRFTDDSTFNETNTATYAWDEPTTELYATVTVEDDSDLFGSVDLGSVTAPSGDTFTYDKDFAWEDFGRDGCGSFTYDNTATIVETDQSDSATLKVNVQCFAGETAWAADGGLPGFLRYTQRGNWATYIDAQELPKEGSIFAGQTNLVGSYSISVAGVLGITLTEPWVLKPGAESVKIQGYDVAPSGNPAPGQFTTYKGSALTGIQLDGSDFYGIHLDVEQPDPDFGP